MYMNIFLLLLLSKSFFLSNTGKAEKQRHFNILSYKIYWSKKKWYSVKVLCWIYFWQIKIVIVPPFISSLVHADIQSKKIMPGVMHSNFHVKIRVEKETYCTMIIGWEPLITEKIFFSSPFLSWVQNCI